MSSLRSRVLASVLVLAAAGMIALAAVTYAEQRSFLESRADQQAQSAVGGLSQLLDQAGLRPAGYVPGEQQDHDSPAGPGDRPAHGGPVNLPPGTYGQRREASGHVIGSKQIKYSPSEPALATPRLPAEVPMGTLLTVGSHGSGGLRVPRLRTARPGGPGHHGRGRAADRSRLDPASPAARRGARDRGRAARPGRVRLVRRPPRSAPAEPHRGHGRSDRRRRSLPPRQPGDPEDGGRPARHCAQRDARPPRAGLRGPHRQRRAPAAVPRRRLARAPHAPGLDPWLRGALPDGCDT